MTWNGGPRLVHVAAAGVGGLKRKHNLDTRVLLIADDRCVKSSLPWKARCWDFEKPRLHSSSLQHPGLGACFQSIEPHFDFHYCAIPNLGGPVSDSTAAERPNGVLGPGRLSGRKW
jgi:hypothetical protein